mgnify:CR=1 FL=1
MPAENRQLQPAATQQAQKRFGAAALRYDSIARLQHDVRRDLLNRFLPQLPTQARVLDLGCGTGRGAQQLLQARPDLSLCNLDFALPMVRRAAEVAPAVNARAEALPFQAGCFDAVYSSLVLQWCADLPRVMAECLRVLRPGGCLMLATLGPGSLQELRTAWRAVDNWQHVHVFLPVTELAAALDGAGLRTVNLWQETRLRHYPSLPAVLRSIRGIGAANSSAGRRPGLMGRQALIRLEQAYAACRDANDQLPVTYEVIFAEVHKP